MNWTDQQRDAIYARDMSVAVSAAAGSGKTAVLTRRIIERVCAPDGSGDISRILAVTFTKAAAAEIITRVERAISEKLAEDPANKHIARQALLVSSAKISTIHSFCLNVLRENFSQVSLPSDFSAMDETRLDIIAKNIMEDLIDECFEDDRDNGSSNYAEFFDTFGSIGKSESQSETLLQIYEKLTCKLRFIDSIDEYIQAYKNTDVANFFDSCWGNELYQYTVAFLGHYKKIFDDALDLARVNDNYSHIEEAFEYETNFIGRVLDAICGGADYFKTGEIMRTYAPPAIKRRKVVEPEPMVDHYKNERIEFHKKLREFTAKYYSFTANDISYASEHTADMLEKLKSFLKTFDSRFRAEKARRHAVSFADMERLTLEILWDAENDAPTAAAMRYRDEFDEIYIDEYQDTNEVQDKIFSLISRPDNKFCVGDVKQSIYGFRGATPDIFEKMLDEREKYSDGIKADRAKIFLSQNFRSSCEVIDFCNCVFDKLMNVDAKRYGADEKLTPGIKRSCGDVEIASFVKESGSSETAEADFVARRIAELAADGRKFSDIAILLRKEKNAKSFEASLSKLNIPFKNAAQKKFFESAEVLLMLSLLNVIDNPARDVYLAAVLKSPLFGVSLDELLYIRRSAGGSLYDALCDFTEKTNFQNGVRFLKFIERFRSLAQSMTCDALIWQIYLETDIFSLVGSGENSREYEKEQAQANLIQLYNYSRTFGGGSYRGLYDFISFINDVIEGKANIKLAQFQTSGDAVSIMTVHESKGLEFPVCFFSDTGSPFNKTDLTKDVLIGKMGIVPKLVHPSGLGKIKTPEYVIASIPERRAMQTEEIRILYVALTRAKDKLIITGTSTRPLDIAPGGPNEAKGKYLSGYSINEISNDMNLICVAAAGKDVCRAVDKDPPAAEAPTETARTAMTLVGARKLVHDRLSFEYPYRGLSAVPSKVAVSRLYPDLLDESEEEEKTASFDYVPRFLSGEDDIITAAERGTATHTFMQFFDFDRVEKNGVDGEIRYLAENKFIFESDVPKIDVKGLEKFFRSDIAKKIRASSEVFREKRFMLAFPADEFTENAELKSKLENEKLLVQGVIDCLYRDDDGKFVLIDYKTDHFSPKTPRSEIEKELRERHTRQLTYYRKACQTLFGEVSHVYIYSFALGGTVEII